MFIDNNRAAVDAIRANLKALGAEGDVRTGSAERVGIVQPIDLAFLDPPYGSGLAAAAISNLPIVPGGWVSVETERGEMVAAEGYEIDVERAYGKARITLQRRAA